MGKIVIFGAGGRTGRAAVTEALRRGHQVTAVVRDPARYSGPAGGGVRVAAGDVTSVPDVIALAAGQDAAIHAAAVYGEGTDPASFFPSAARALVAGLPQAGVGRLVAAGWTGCTSAWPATSTTTAGAPAATTSATTVTSPPASPTLTLPSPCSTRPRPRATTAAT